MNLSRVLLECGDREKTVHPCPKMRPGVQIFRRTERPGFRAMAKLRIESVASIGGRNRDFAGVAGLLLTGNRIFRGGVFQVITF